MKSIPGTTWPVWKATCSVSAKKLSGLRFSVILPTVHDRHEFFGDDLGRVEKVEAEFVLVLLLDDLETELPFGEVAPLDRLPEVAAVEVRVFAGDLLGLFPHERANALPGFQWNFTKRDLPCALTSRKVWTPKPSIIAKAARDGAIAHHPHQHVGALGRQRDEVPEGVVRRLRLRESR